MEDSLKILRMAAAGDLPDEIDEQSDIPVSLVQELVEAGLLKAIDTSTTHGDCLNDVKITFAGRQYLQTHDVQPDEIVQTDAHLRATKNVLLSWSKQQSKAAALALRDWLPTVIPGIHPWMSSKDIDKGREWWVELQGALREFKVCIVCLTAENVRSPWLYYETGAIAVKEDGVLVLPYLIGISADMLSDGPLGKWQCTVATYDDTWELITSLNKNALNCRHDIDVLEGNYKSKWSELEAKLQPLLESELGESASDNFIVTDADQIAGAQLTSEARTIIVEAAQDPHGMVLVVRYSGGACVQTNGKDLCGDSSARTIARWISAVDELTAIGLLRPRGHQGEVYELTGPGFEVADSLKQG